MARMHVSASIGLEPMMLWTALAALSTVSPYQEKPPAAPAPRVWLISGANNHDWQYTDLKLTSILETGGHFVVQHTATPETDLAKPEAWKDVRALVLNYNGPRWGAAAEEQFLSAVKAGVGVVVVHAADNAFPGWTEYELLVGDLWRDGTSHGNYHAFDVEILDRDHPITAGLAKLRAHPDELYHNLVRTPGSNYRVLASAFSSPESRGTGKLEPMLLVGSFGAGRVVHTPLGHVWKDDKDSRATFDHPQIADLLVRATQWAATGEVSLPPSYLPNTLSAREIELGWKLLFDGQTNAGWKSYNGSEFPSSGWSVRDGALVHAAGGGGGDLVTTEQYADCELEFEWKIGPKGNSGVMLRVLDGLEQTYVSGPEYQVLDDQGHGLAADDWHSAGALYELATPIAKPTRPVGEWNQARVVIQGWRVEHWLNGARILSMDLGSEAGRKQIAASKFASWPSFATGMRGRIALQDHGDEVSYRNLKIRPLTDEAR